MTTTERVTQFDAKRLKRTRRTAGAAIALTGIVNIASSLTPPLRRRFELLHDVLPITVPQTAAAVVAGSGVALLLLSRSVRRGQRHAWALALVLVGLSGVLHLLKGLDVEEAAAAGLVIGYLVTRRGAFQAPYDRPSLWRAFSVLATGASVAVLTGTMTALWLPRTSHLSIWRAFEAVTERLAGINSIPIPGPRRDHFLTIVLGAAGLVLALAAIWIVLRPVLHRPLQHGRDCTRAREIVARYGGDTLGYFALRDDKHHWIWGDTLIAYAVINGVCLVSPDPVGPEDEREAAWSAFRAHVDSNGWSVAVMGASADWLPIYRASGLRDLYVGDEAIVDVRSFSLEGGRNKGLRQAVNRIAKKGYTIAFMDPSVIDHRLEARLRRLMTESRRGEVERGFSMTLGRVFSPEDKGLLLAVCYGPDGEPCAFCQFVPAPAIEGWSLDLMRRSESPEHWNGVTDFVVVRTIEHMRDLGCRGLGLNFAVMRSVLAEEDPRLGQRIERRLLGWLSESMQIESLWRYNAKFHPEWLPRYAVYDSVESFIPAALAVARAESFWELPVIGRFLTPEQPATPLSASRSG